jgi:hypothetical protein
MPARRPFLSVLLIAGSLGVQSRPVDLTLDASSYIGASDEGGARDVAVDAQGNIYVTGGTSAGCPRTLGPGAQGEIDVCVAKFTPAGGLVWARVLGGPGHDRAYAVEVDATGAVYLAGRAGPRFPTTAGVLQQNFGGDNVGGAYGQQDGFVAKVAPDGARLLWATYFGGPGPGFIRDLDIDASGSVYVVASGAAPRFPHVTAGAFQYVHGGQTDAVVAKISPDGGRVIWGSYLGGAGSEFGGPSVRVDATGHVLTVGNSNSPDMPTPNGFGGRHAGGGDAYLARFTPDGSGLVYGTYLGGRQGEGTGTHNLAIDTRGNAYAGHWTFSAEIPIVGNAVQRRKAGTTSSTDAIVWKVSPVGELLANTYVGGSDGENVQGMAIDAEGNVFLSLANVRSADLPVTPGAFQTARRGPEDGALVVLSGDLSRVIYATYVGGGGSDSSRSLALDPTGRVVLAGASESPDWPARNAFRPTRQGDSTNMVFARFTRAAGAGTP